MPETNDQDLVERAQKGEIQAFNLLVRRWQKPVLNFLYRFLGNLSDAEEACQRTFIRVYEKLPGLGNGKKFSVWLYRVAANQARDLLRQKKRQRLVSFFEFWQKGSEEEPLEPADPQGLSAEDRLHQEDLRSILLNALQQIPEEQRIIVIMRIFHELKFHEIAEILGEPLNTVKSRMYYGLKSLRNVLEKQHFDREVFWNELQ